jgi:hypothetical protein
VSTGIYSLEYTRQLLSSLPAKVKPTPASPDNLILEDIQYREVKFSYDQKALQSIIYVLKEQLMAAKAKTALYAFSSKHLEAYQDIEINLNKKGD